MRPIDVLRALAYPLANQAVLAAFVTFYLFLELIGWIIGLGLLHLVSALILAAFVIPALCLYLIFMLDARTADRDPDPPGIEHLLWYGSAWSLLQVLYYTLLAYGIYLVGSLYGAGPLLVTMLLVSAALPASLAILAVTHSPVESLNPVAIQRLVSRCGWTYWIAPTFFLGALFLFGWLSSLTIPDWLTELIGLYLLFAFYTLTGAIVQPHNLHGEVGIYEPLEPDEGQNNASLARIRTDVLGHAYGFISRGNRAGGFKHIRDWLAEDPDPVFAWQWFFNEMLNWDQADAALFFGQEYLGWLLRQGDQVAAVKLMMRCRLENGAFRPLPDDRELALEAAEYCQHDELANLLR